MGKLRHVTGIIAAAAVALASHVHAADVDEAPVFVEPEVTPVEYGTGWYLRGDIGLTYHETKRESSTSVPVLGTPNQNVSEIDQDNVINFGAGVGYRFNNNFRTDIGVDSFASFESSTSSTLAVLRSPCAPAEVRTVINDPNNNPITVINPNHNIINCQTEDSASYDMIAFMLNGYYEFDSSFMGLRPFVGGGVGLMQADFSSVQGSTRCVPSAEERCVPTDGGNPQFGEEYTQEGTRNNGTSYHLAGSILAGVSYPISQNLHFDTTYRYTHMVEDPLWGGLSGVDMPGIPTSFHTIKVGLRYEIW